MCLGVQPNSIVEVPREKRRFIEALGRPLDRLSSVHGFLPALSAFVGALALHWIFVALIGQNFAGIFFVYLAAMIIAGWCGYAPGMVVVLLVVLLPPWLFTPNWSPRNINLSGDAVLMLVSVMISRGAAARRGAEALLRTMNSELERRVRKKTVELAEANDALQRHAADLTRANADLEQFAYSASHDLQEPLRMLCIFTQLIQQKYAGKLDGEARMETLIKACVPISPSARPRSPRNRWIQRPF